MRNCQSCTQWIFLEPLFDRVRLNVSYHQSYMKIVVQVQNTPKWFIQFDMVSPFSAESLVRNIPRFFRQTNILRGRVLKEGPKLIVWIEFSFRSPNGTTARCQVSTWKKFSVLVSGGSLSASKTACLSKNRVYVLFVPYSTPGTVCVHVSKITVAPQEKAWVWRSQLHWS